MAKYLVALVCSFSLLAPMVQAAAKDPTAPPSYQAPERQVKQQRLPSLQATFTGAKPAAILNQHMVYLGESVAGFTLSKVERDYVVMARSGKHYKIQLDRITVKQTVE